jgi:hypothetical protein
MKYYTNPELFGHVEKTKEYCVLFVTFLVLYDSLLENKAYVWSCPEL